MLFETLTGHVPFERPTELAKMHAHINDPVPALSDAVPEIPDALSEIVARALAKAPEDRFASAAELVTALDGVLADLEHHEQPRTDVTAVLSEPEPVPTTTASPRRSRPSAGVLAAALAGLAALAGAVVVIASSGGGGGTHTSSTPPVASTTSSRTEPIATTGLPSLHGDGLHRGNQIQLAAAPAGLATDGTRAWAIAPGRLFELRAGGGAVSIPLDGDPTNVAVDSRGRVWVTLKGHAGATIVDPLTHRPTSVRTAVTPDLIAMSATAAWLARKGGTTVERVPLDAGAARTIDVPRPIAALGAANGRIWVAPASGAVTVIDDNGRLDGTQGPAIAPSTVEIAQSNGVWFLSSSLTRVDPRRKFAIGATYAVHPDQAPIGNGPLGIGALDHDNTIWVLTKDDRTLRRIGTIQPHNNQTTARVVFPGTPGDLAVGDHVLWVDVPATKTVYPIGF